MDKYSDLKAFADPFIDLANTQVAKGAEPIEVGDGFLYGAARYHAFIVAQSAQSTDVARGVLAKRVVQAFGDALWHHLAQMVGSTVAEDSITPPAWEDGLMPATAPDAQAFSDALGPILQALSNIDLVLVAYLRGAGRHDIADDFALHVTEKQSNASWDVAYAGRVYEAMESGTLAEPIALFVITQILTSRMMNESTTGYLEDPVLVDGAGKRHGDFYARYQLHKVATLVRKYPQKLEDVSNEGMAQLLGPRAVAAINLFRKTRARNAH